LPIEGWIALILAFAPVLKVAIELLTAVVKLVQTILESKKTQKK